MLQFLLKLSGLLFIWEFLLCHSTGLVSVPCAGLKAQKQQLCSVNSAAITEPKLILHMQDMVGWLVQLRLSSQSWRCKPAVDSQPSILKPDPKWISPCPTAADQSCSRVLCLNLAAQELHDWCTEHQHTFPPSRELQGWVIHRWSKPVFHSSLDTWDPSRTSKNVNLFILLHILTLVLSASGNICS